MNKVVLVACVAAKQNVSAKAKDLYISDLFSKARSYAERHSTAGRWYILSAKYGLTEPDSLLTPYNLTLKPMRKAEREQWAGQVSQAVRRLTDPHHDIIVFLAGKDYREPLATLLSQQGYQIEIPMQGLRIGQQLHWLGEN